jgi:TRAP-type C4-dicarboxylate transport system substrate-binding protein
MATAYVLGASRSYPIMQLDLKENIQNMTNGKVYVRLAPGGQLGAGGALVQGAGRHHPVQRSIRCRTSRLSRRSST